MINEPESAIVREAALRFITCAGPEIGVASTKAFSTQLLVLFMWHCCWPNLMIDC
jgi:glucosamine--fructose-6-phosphate aminotransferase (isomerizing)